MQQALFSLEQQLTEAAKQGRSSLELAFYGGTFTALPREWIARFLAVTQHFQKKGLLTRVRCSTRPDAITPQMLEWLGSSGLSLVELGIQSFHADVLCQSKRGYMPQQAIDACRMVTESGLELGIQLLPGLPAMTPQIFRDDVARACSLHPSVMRLYPCLVFKGTGLARLYARGEYSPWSVTQSARLLGEALTVAWEHSVNVIRLGVAQEPGLQESLLAGPYHPALGSMARGYALLGLIQQKIACLSHTPKLLLVPRQFSGEFWGHKGELKPEYSAFGISPKNVRWWNFPVFCMV